MAYREHTSPRVVDTNGPIPAFDHQLKTLSDSYIAFYQERVRIEETYCESLFRLHRNIRALDNLLDDRDPSSVRLAWRELRDNIEREAETRTAFANTIKSDVLPPLHGMREIQERTRKRIKEDLKESTIAHLDYAENVLPRLKRAYIKKCQEVEEFKAAERPSLSQAPTTTNIHMPPPSSNYSNVMTTGTSPPSPPPRSSFDSKERVNVISPQPTHPSAIPPQVSNRNRSPSTATALSDLAHHGKKGLNQLMGFLEQGRERGGIGGSLRESGDRANGLRGVRAKREADEANKEYRKGVHWLETLRLRRVKTLQAGYTSLELFVSESGEIMKKALETYVDCVTGTASTCSHLASYAQSAIAKISTETDLERVNNFVKYAFSRAVPPQTFYYNFQVGECPDLVFGVSLVDYATARNSGGEVPSLVRKCIKEIDKRGLTAEGIYRVPGRHAVVQELTHRIELNERAFEFNPATEDVYAVSGLLKLYLRELPEPVFKYPLAERLQYTEDREEQIANGFRSVRSKIRRLPPVHQATLRALVEHLTRVASHAAQTKMDSKNLAIVFPIFGEDEMPKGSDVLSMQNWKDTLMEDLINFSSVIFDDRPAANAQSIKSVPSVETQSTVAFPTTPAEAPLPLPPAETPSVADYGSSYTKVTSLPPRSAGSQKESDFTPTLPTRPPHSIHPSRRNNALEEDGGDDGESDPETHSFRPTPSRIETMDDPAQEGFSPLDDYRSVAHSLLADGTPRTQSPHTPPSASAVLPRQSPKSIAPE